MDMTLWKIEGAVARWPSKHGDVLIDASDLPRLPASWCFNVTRYNAWFTHGRANCIALSKVIMQPPEGVRVKRGSARPLDFRKANMRLMK